jgi:hypothetical protein
MEETSDSSWTGSVRDSIRHFVTAVSESTRQLASTAERFAAESLQLVEEATEKARRSASTSSDMARAAGQAAEETRRAAASLEEAAQQAITSLQTETQRALEQVTSRTAELRETSDHLKSDIEQRSGEMLAQLEEATASSRSLLEASQMAIAEARGLVGRVDERRTAAEAALAAAEGAAEQARQSAILAEQASSQLVARPDAQEVLKRLEVDYRLLAPLVQELRELIGRMTSTAAQVAPALSQQPVQPGSPGTAGVRAQVDTAPMAAAPIAVMSGQIEVRISPVPDFDRLLQLDGVLGRLSIVGNVGLADFLNEEVTFRVDLVQPVAALHLARMVGEAAGVAVEVMQAAETALALRLG